MFNNFINQDYIKSQLESMVRALKNNILSGINVLFISGPGQGKTYLSKLFCRQISRNFEYIMCNPKIGINSNVEGVFLLDEVHQLRNIESLYPVMDKGNSVVVSTTTEFNKLQEPFISRNIVLSFSAYSIDDMSKIILNYAHRIKFYINDQIAYKIASYSRNNPRYAIMLTKRLYTFLYDYGYITKQDILNVLNQIGIFTNGYTNQDLRYLEIVKDKGPISLSNISRIMGVSEAFIKNSIEPFLLSNNKITITSKGRSLTKKEKK